MEALIPEISLKAIRSSGSGGQHVNKVSTKVELSFNILSSAILNESQKERLLLILKSRLTKKGVLILQCGESRSQHKNKEIVINRFLQLITNGIKVPKKRKATKPSKSSIQKRLDKKKKIAFKKVSRKKPDLN